MGPFCLQGPAAGAGMGWPTPAPTSVLTLPPVAAGHPGGPGHAECPGPDAEPAVPCQPPLWGTSTDSGCYLEDLSGWETTVPVAATGVAMVLEASQRWAFYVSGVMLATGFGSLAVIVVVGVVVGYCVGQRVEYPTI